MAATALSSSTLAMPISDPAPMKQPTGNFKHTSRPQRAGYTQRSQAQHGMTDLGPVAGAPTRVDRVVLEAPSTSALVADSTPSPVLGTRTTSAGAVDVAGNEVKPSACPLSCFARLNALAQVYRCGNFSLSLARVVALWTSRAAPDRSTRTQHHGHLPVPSATRRTVLDGRGVPYAAGPWGAANECPSVFRGQTR